MQPLTDAEKAALIRRRFPAMKWSDTAHRWLVPMDELLELVIESRRLRGLTCEPSRSEPVSFLASEDT